MSGVWHLARSAPHRASHLASASVMATGDCAARRLREPAGDRPGDTRRDSGFLIMLPAILGGWTVAIVAPFGVVSTVSLTIEHRERELALLRSIAATPRQIRQSVVLETVVVALPAIAVGLLPGVGLARSCSGNWWTGGLVGPGAVLEAGWLCVAIGAGTPSLSAAVAAALISSRPRRLHPRRYVRPRRRSSRPHAHTRGRVIAGAGLLLVGLSLSATTLLMDDGPPLSSTAGPAGVAVAVGLALLSPAAVLPIGWLSNARFGAIGRLAARNVHARAVHTGGVASPLILLVGIAGGTLYMQSTEDSVHRDTADVSVQLAVNYLVVAMIITFTAIVVVNTLIAATQRRRREFGLLRLSAATRGQVLGMVEPRAR